MIDTQPYTISNEHNITELLSHLDSDYVLETIKDKLNNRNFATFLSEPNIVASFEENFKMMNQQFPGDDDNIKNVRYNVYKNIIIILCEKYNLRFNFDDDNIDLYTAAYYLYDFLVSNYRPIMVNFFTSFIVNNKDSLYNNLNLESYKKNKDSGTMYNKKVYGIAADQKYVIIGANIEKVINYIKTLDISLYNIFQSTYVDPKLVEFLDNAVADNGNFFNDFYCNIILRQELMPIIITDIRLQLQKIVGDVRHDTIENYINRDNEGEVSDDNE